MRTKAFRVVLAVFAVGMLAVASASATLWLINSQSVEKETAATTHGLIVLHHTGGLIGNFLVHCTGLVDGFVGPGALDLVTKLLNLTGTQENKITCEFSTPGSCGTNVGELVLVTALNLPWHSLLELLSNGTTVDHLLNESGKSPGGEINCPKIGLSATCTGLGLADFLFNASGGAVFESLGTSKASCSDGGEGTVLGLGTVLGVLVS